MTNNEYYKKLTEMKVRFNELSQKLNNDYGLCSQVANLIDLTAETRELTERLSCVDSKIPSINLKIQALISGCNNNLSQYYENTLSNIITTFTQSGRVLPDGYMTKIQKTISCCIENYEIYKTSDYAIKYSQNNSATSSKLSLETILEL